MSDSNGICNYGAKRRNIAENWCYVIRRKDGKYVLLRGYPLSSQIEINRCYEETYGH
jgi:hypothetical protein